jgi:hypothetical protein
MSKVRKDGFVEKSSKKLLSVLAAASPGSLGPVRKLPRVENIGETKTSGRKRFFFEKKEPKNS